jgi:hypothetical protein
VAQGAGNEENVENPFSFVFFVVCSRQKSGAFCLPWEKRMVRLQVGFSRDEADALTRWATSELRDPRDQIRFLVRQELCRRGWLSDSHAHTEQNEREEDLDG